MARPEWMRGRELRDATRNVTINIRQHHIDEATALNGERCVAGLCTLQALDAQAVWFYRSKAYVAWDDDAPILRYQNSSALIRDVIRVLDDPKRPNSEIKPGLYDLLAPSPAQRLGVDRRRKPGGEIKGPKRDSGHEPVGKIMGRAIYSWKKAAA